MTSPTSGNLIEVGIIHQQENRLNPCLKIGANEYVGVSEAPSEITDDEVAAHLVGIAYLRSQQFQLQWREEQLFQYLLDHPPIMMDMDWKSGVG